MMYLSAFIVAAIGVGLIVLSYVRYDEVGRYPMGWGTGLILCAIGLFARTTSAALSALIFLPGAVLCVASTIAERRNKTRRSTT